VGVTAAAIQIKFDGKFIDRGMAASMASWKPAGFKSIRGSFFPNGGAAVSVARMRHAAVFALTSLAVARVALAQSTVGPPTAQAPPPAQSAPPPVTAAQAGPPAPPTTIQHPEDLLVPAPASPAPLKLDYVPGYRAILTGHKENYFLSGFSKTTQVKFQFSAKFDMWPNASRHSVYFGFTQKSFWRLYDTSSPFQESDYNPELFYGYFKRGGDIVPRAGGTAFFLQNARLGIEHESNGLDGKSSRSWNRAYGYARAGVYSGTDHYLTLAPKVWYAVRHGALGLDDNPDILDYLGYGSLTAEYGFDPTDRRWYGGGLLGATVRRGTGAATWGVESYAQWRPGYRGSALRWFKFTPYLYAQLCTGYGESLLLYNQKVTSFRVGIALEDKVNWKTVVKAPADGRSDDGL
jgi:outer membrane phospholipase A